MFQDSVYRLFAVHAVFFYGVPERIMSRTAFFDAVYAKTRFRQDEICFCRCGSFAVFMADSPDFLVLDFCKSVERFFCVAPKCFLNLTFDNFPGLTNCTTFSDMVCGPFSEWCVAASLVTGVCIPWSLFIPILIYAIYWALSKVFLKSAGQLEIFGGKEGKNRKNVCLFSCGMV